MAQPVRPEPKFFVKDELYTRGIDFYETHFFSGKTSAWLRGEKTTSYIESERAARRIAHHYPKARIIILMRDPIARAVSNYWFSQEHGLETWPLEKALRSETPQRPGVDYDQVSVNPFDYLRRGRYMDFIDLYDSLFSSEQVCGLLYEQLPGNLPLVQALYTWLGVSRDFEPARLHLVVNKGKARNEKLSPSLKAYLVDYYADANARLAARFEYTLEDWWSSCQ